MHTKRMLKPDIITLNDLQLKAKVSIKDQFKMGPGFDTRVRIIARNTEYDGSQSIVEVKNKTILPGRTQLLENVFGITPNMAQHIFINDNVLASYDAITGQPVNAINANYNTALANLPRSNIEMFKRRTVEYWCAGDGAMNRTVQLTSYEPHATDTRLYHMIPFRFIPKERSLSAAERSMYKMEIEFPNNTRYAGYKGYFLKKITYDKSKTGINMVVDGMDYVPKVYDTTPDLNADTAGIQNSFKGDRVQQNYIDMAFGVNELEFKEWFDFVDGSRTNATISEIGLVTGLDCVRGQGIARPMFREPAQNQDPTSAVAQMSEIYDAEVFAHLTFDPYTVARDNATIDFEYRIFS